MSNSTNRQRLLGCFQAVFPDVDEAALADASVDSLSGWDSVAQATLIAVVEEEFGIAIPPEQYEELTSVRVFLEAVGANTHT